MNSLLLRFVLALSLCGVAQAMPKYAKARPPGLLQELHRKCGAALGALYPGNWAHLDPALSFVVDQGGRIRVASAAHTRQGIAVIPEALNALAYPLGFWRMNAAYRQAIRDPRTYLGFPGKALDAVNAHRIFDVSRLDWIPATGPLVIVANHPLSGREALAILDVLRVRRPDLKVLMNKALAGIPEMRAFGIFVDPAHNGEIGNGNDVGSLEAIRHVRQQKGALLVFPAGSVSDRDGSTTRVPVDGPWEKNIARLIRAARATVLPIFVHGQPSSAFLKARALHPALATPLIVRELTARDEDIRLTIGRAISPATWAGILDADRTAWFRAQVYALSGSHANARTAHPVALQPPTDTRTLKEIAEPIDAARLETEIARLEKRGFLLNTQSGMKVFAAPASEMPDILLELGRLREIVFRSVGEGSGGERDIDKYDPHYVHLFAWNVQDRALVGAYRLGPVDQIVGKVGIEGIYNQEFFDLTKFVERYASQTIDLGRSFVVPKYAGRGLLVLFQNIAEYVRRNPTYRFLLGSVSMSRTYSETSRQLLLEFLRHAHYDAAYAELVTSRREPQFDTPLSAAEAKLLVSTIGDIRALAHLVKSIEPPLRAETAEGRSIPDLYRPYLALGGRMIAFLEDESFNTNDGLVLIDLATTPIDELAKYMGMEEALAYQARHR